METNGNQQKLIVASNGNQWKPMETNGNRWKPMETDGNQWKPMETNGNQKMTTVTIWNSNIWILECCWTLFGTAEKVLRISAATNFI